MRKVIKKRLITTLLVAALSCSSLTAYAAPKTMPDGQTFDPQYYAETYPDVKAAFGNDEKALYDHYVTYGKAEGRLPYADAGKEYVDPITITITEGEGYPDPQTIMDAIMEAMPAGTKWGFEKWYKLQDYKKGNGVAREGQACQAFAYWVQDALFDKEPAKYLSGKGTPIYVWDIVLMKDHAAVVTAISEDGQTLTLAEGNVNGKISYGRTVNVKEVYAVITRY